MNEPHVLPVTPQGRTNRPVASVVLIASLFFTVSVTACPFCARLGKTFTDAVAEAEYVIDGEILSGDLAGISEGAGQSRFQPKRIIKSPGSIDLAKPIELSRYLPASSPRSNRRILFAQRDERGLDPYRSMLVADDAVGAYIETAVRATSLGPKRKYAFFFQNLEHPNAEIAEDAYKEFAKAPYLEVKEAATAYDSTKLRGWLADEGIPSYRIGLYGLLLGTAGRAEDADYLERLIHRPEDRWLYGIDGIMAGYCLLQPTKGADLVLDVVANPEEPFKRRYAALATVRFLLTDFEQTNRVQILQRLSEALAIVDTADLIIDDLRRHATAETAPAVFALQSNPAYASSVIQRAILRFALTADVPAAGGIVESIRNAHPDWIAQEQQNLDFEKAVRTEMDARQVKPAQ